MSDIYTKKSFKQELLLADRGVPKALLLLGSSDAVGAIRQINSVIAIKKVQATALPNIYTGFVNNKLIAFGSTYATSFTADIVHAYSEIGVKKIALFGFCGAIQTKLKKGDVVSPKIIYDNVGIFKAYGISKKRHVIRLNTTGPDEFSVVTWHNLFSENTKLIKKWKNQNIDVVDLESAAIVAACNHKGIKPLIQLIIADQLYKNEHLQKTYKTSYKDLCQKRIKLIQEYVTKI